MKLQDLLWQTQLRYFAIEKLTTLLAMILTIFINKKVSPDCFCLLMKRIVIGTSPCNVRPKPNFKISIIFFSIKTYLQVSISSQLRVLSECAPFKIQMHKKFNNSTTVKHRIGKRLQNVRETIFSWEEPFLKILQIRSKNYVKRIS